MGSLYVVSTPIGNLSDLSKRALETLKAVHLIAAEDTRNTLKLCNHFEIKTKLSSYHKHNEQSRTREYLHKLLVENEDIALVSDAGTPCISDPGFELVRACRSQGIPVVAVPGSCALISALSASGLPSEQFSFYGFLSRVKKERHQSLKAMLESPIETFVLYESPNRVIQLLTEFQDFFAEGGIRHLRVCVFNDITKLHERVYFGTSEAVIEELTQNPRVSYGEYTLVINKTKDKDEENEGKEEEEKESDQARTLEGLLVDCLVRGLDMKSSIEAVTAMGSKKNLVYAASLRLKKMLSST